MRRKNTIIFTYNFEWVQLKTNTHTHTISYNVICDMRICGNCLKSNKENSIETIFSSHFGCCCSSFLFTFTHGKIETTNHANSKLHMYTADTLNSGQIVVFPINALRKFQRNSKLSMRQEQLCGVRVNKLGENMADR